MKALFWIGLVILILGICSFFVSIPHRENHGVKIGGASVGVQTRDDQKLPPVLSGVLVGAGVVLLIAGARGR